jgi:hypothetical protein
MAILLTAHAVLWAVTGSIDVFRAPALPPRLEIPSPVTLALSVLNLTVAVGMLLLRHWAWLAALILQGVILAWGLVTYYRGEPHYVTMAVAALLVFYLNLREVRRPFGVEDLDPEKPLRELERR